MRRDETVLLFKDLYKTLSAIPAEDAGILMKALFAHANGLDPDGLDASPIAAALYIGLSDQMDRIEEYRNSQAAKRTKTEQTVSNDNKQEQTETNAEQITSPSPSPSPSPYPYPYPSPMSDMPGKTGPTVQEVKDFADEEGLVIDAERFVAYYDAKDWMTGTDPIKDWKKVARKWAVTERKEKPPDKKKPGKFSAWLESQDYSNLVSGRRA